MSYLKPNYPLSNANGSFYPLTTADQVLLSDGTRLEKGGRVVADVSANSEMLGGKAPGYYLSPRNLLDNSDFRNPVNQRGQTSYTGTYTIDRWRVWNENTTVNLVSNGITIANSSTDSAMQLVQYFDSEQTQRLTGKSLTFAIGMANGNVYTVNANGGGVGTNSDIMSAAEGCFLRLGTGNGGLLSCSIYVPANTTSNPISWAALYEGSYTSETLPPYVPKGYAAELAECQRYFRLLSSYWCIGYIIVGTGYLIVESIGLMRAKPSVILKSNIGIYSTQTSWYDSSVKEIIQQDDRYWITFPWHDSITKEGFFLVNGLYALSADL